MSAIDPWAAAYLENLTGAFPSLEELILGHKTEIRQEQLKLHALLQPMIDPIIAEGEAGRELYERFRDLFGTWKFQLTISLDCLKSQDPQVRAKGFQQIYRFGAVFGIYHRVMQDLMPAIDREIEH